MNEVPKQGRFESEAVVLPSGHPPVAFDRIGVLLLNLGTPDGTDYWPMRRYLKEFLSDERVIEEPRWKWWPILNLIILTVRPGPKGRDYATIWNNDKNEGPLKTNHTKPSGEIGKQARRRSADRRRLGDALCQSDDGEPYPGAERAGVRPNSACSALSSVRRRDNGDGLRRCVPGADEDALAAVGAHDAELSRSSGYIDALARSTRKQLDALDFEPEKIIATFHGMPQKYFAAGDPYHCQCQKTSRLLREKLGISEERWADDVSIAFRQRSVASALYG